MLRRYARIHAVAPRAWLVGTAHAGGRFGALRRLLGRLDDGIGVRSLPLRRPAPLDYEESQHDARRDQHAKAGGAQPFDQPGNAAARRCRYRGHADDGLPCDLSRLRIRGHADDGLHGGARRIDWVTWRRRRHLNHGHVHDGLDRQRHRIWRVQRREGRMHHRWRGCGLDHAPHRAAVRVRRGAAGSSGVGTAATGAAEV